MNVARYNVSFTPDLVARIDAVAGSRGRSAFLAQAAEKALEAGERVEGGRIPLVARPAPAPPRPSAPRRPRLMFDPSRFNQARSLR